MLMSLNEKQFNVEAEVCPHIHMHTQEGKIRRRKSDGNDIVALFVSFYNLNCLFLLATCFDKAMHLFCRVSPALIPDPHLRASVAHM